MQSGIYKIKCCSNSKIYIGSSFNIESRLKKHFTQLKNQNHINPHLQSAYNKYGCNDFISEIIELCSVEDLISREQFWMDFTKCYDRKIGFNNCRMADRPLGYRHTDEAKKKMSKSKRGKKLTQEHIDKIKKSNTGKRRTREQRKRMSESKKGAKNPMFGKKESEEHKKKRMKNCLSVPRWNKGLTKDVDSRLQKLATWEGKLPPNAIKCTLINIKTQEKWQANSLKMLSQICPLSLPTINRLKNNTCGKKTKETYKLIYES